MKVGVMDFLSDVVLFMVGSVFFTNSFFIVQFYINDIF